MSLWRHTVRPIHFCLCVDDFKVTYFNEEDIKYFFNALNSKYKHSVDWKGTNYCGLHLGWNYVNKYVDIYMPNYINAVLKNFSIHLQNINNIHYIIISESFTHVKLHDKQCHPQTIYLSYRLKRQHMSNLWLDPFFTMLEP